MNVNIYTIKSDNFAELEPTLVEYIGKCSTYTASHNKVYIIVPSEFPMEERNVLFYEVTRRPYVFFIRLLLKNLDFTSYRKYSVEKKKFFFTSPSFYEYVKKSTNIGDKNIINDIINTIFETVILD